MATCFCVEQSFDNCDGLPPSGSVLVTLAGPTACSLFDPADSKWHTTGKKATVSLVDGKWTSPKLPCLNELMHSGITATDAGFYYTFTVAISSGFTCTYKVLGDCTAMTIPLTGCIPLEDVMTEGTPVVNPNAGCTAVQACETTTTLVNNGDGTYTYTNEDGGTTIIDASANAGVDADINNVTVAGSIVTFHNENGTTITLDICGVVSGNCNSTLTANANGTWTHRSNAGVLTSYGPFISTITAGANSTYTATSTNGTTVSWGGGTGTETTTTLVNNNNGTYTYTNEAGAAVVIDVTAGPVGSLVDNGAGSLVFDPGDGSAVTTIPICDLVADGNCGGTGGGAETTTTLVNNNNGSFTYTNEAGAAVTWNETTSTLVANANGSFTYTNEDGAQTVIPAAATGTPETTTTLVNNNNGSFTYTNEAGTPVTYTEKLTSLVVDANGGLVYTNEQGVANTVKTAERDVLLFPSRDTVTTVGKSGLYQTNRPISVTGISFTAGVPPTAGETFVVRTISAAGAVLATLGTGTLAAGSRSTGVIAVGPFTIATTSLLEVELTSANGSERSTVHVYFTETTSDFTV